MGSRPADINFYACSSDDASGSRPMCSLTASLKRCLHPRYRCVVRSEPIPDTHSQPPDTLHTPNACRKIRAKKSAIGCFIGQPLYRCQSQVNRRRGVRALSECDSVPCDNGPVEGHPGLRAVPFDEFTNGMVV